MDHGACDALPRGNSHGKPDRLASNDWKESERKQPVEDGTLTSSATKDCGKRREFKTARPNTSNTHRGHICRSGSRKTSVHPNDDNHVEDGTLTSSATISVGKTNSEVTRMGENKAVEQVEGTCRPGSRKNGGSEKGTVPVL